MTGLRSLWLTVFVLAACSDPASKPSPQPGSGSAATIAPKPRTVDLLGSMATLVGLVARPEYLADWANKLDGGQAQLGGFIDEILGTDRFASEVVPTLVFGAYVNVRNYYALPSAFILKRSPDGAPMYLRAPCTVAEGVTVRPWWDLDSEVTVCPDSYRPDKWTMARDEHSYKTETVLTCDSQVGSPELETRSLCGCGPNLIRCLRDEDQYNQFSLSMMNEVKRTTAYVVQHDLPMASLFTGNSTFRDRNAELYYRRQKVGALETKLVEAELATIAAWPQDGRWAPRDEIKAGQHAGVLTTPQILHWLPDRRQRQRGYYEVLWCNLRNSFGATTQKVLEINTTGNNFFATDSWKKLAHTELCTNCHARLDYGFQFFMAYPDSRASTHYNPALQATTTGPLYGQDIADFRGDAPLTPLGFATLATAQPDFKSCMANHFVSYVLGDRATPDDTRAIETAVAQTGTFKPPMKVALERYAARWREETRAAPAVAAPPGSPVGPKGGVMVSAALRTKLDKHCTECHDETPYSDNPDSSNLPFDFTTAELPRSLLVSMADQVAFAMMPKDQPLEPAARDEVVGLLIDTLWTDPAARTEARHHYLGKARGLPAHQIDNAFNSIDHIAHAPAALTWGVLERAIWPDQSTITPGFLAVTALAAVRACGNAMKSRGITLVDCLLETTSLEVLSRWSPSHAP